MDRFTITLGPELFTLLRDRASYNRRSMSQECVFLIECALAEEIEGNRTIMRTLMMATGGVASLPNPAQADPEPEHTAMDESQPSS